ncbi:iron-containing alcohol dehydrogenase family protein [Paraburkholderia sp. ZP32-5]|uniref:iron-containing alcohol dehydrogenase family protein n=1 Tax=Paraburkholderia sp. ZP32-5 TaxID=2883245 RepID=UPI001F43A3C4|nr:iron-containing alcohol dehydrogenase family protein [Paraburkholderia sp. ZP32-5]
MYNGNIGDWPKHVEFGRASLSRIRDVMDRIGAKRAVVMCGNSVASGPMLTMVKNALGDRYAGVFTGVRAHTPLEDVLVAAAEIQKLQADVVVSVGGGSAIDAAKGVVLALATGGDYDPYAIKYADKGMQRASLGAATLRHIAVPTTAGSASDVMPTAGIRDVAANRKLLFWDSALVPDATILDPEMAVFAGAKLTAASGMTAVARAIESLYSKDRNPIATGLALHAARLMRKSLPVAVEHPDDLDARADCQFACVMSGTAAINSMVSVVHAIGHVVGGRYGLQHGISHGIMLAPALRKLLPMAGGDAHRYVLDALGCEQTDSVTDAANTAANAIGALLARLPLPQRLRDVGVTEEEIADIAHHTMGDYMMANLPGPLGEQDVEALLREAW